MNPINRHWMVTNLTEDELHLLMYTANKDSDMRFNLDTVCAFRPHNLYFKVAGLDNLTSIGEKIKKNLVEKLRKYWIFTE